MSPIIVGGRKISGALSSAPSSPSEGDKYWHTANNKLYVYDGTNWMLSLIHI